jgi:hypothetical protein
LFFLFFKGMSWLTTLMEYIENLSISELPYGGA